MTEKKSRQNKYEVYKWPAGDNGGCVRYVSLII